MDTDVDSGLMSKWDKKALEKKQSGISHSIMLDAAKYALGPSQSPLPGLSLKQFQAMLSSIQQRHADQMMMQRQHTGRPQVIHLIRKDGWTKQIPTPESFAADHAWYQLPVASEAHQKLAESTGVPLMSDKHIKFRRVGWDTFREVDE